MKTYQEYLLDLIERRAHEAWRNAERHHPANTPGLFLSTIEDAVIATVGPNARTVAVLHTDLYGSNRVALSLNSSNGEPGQPVRGPRGPGVYHWTPANEDVSDTDAKATRMLGEWGAAIEEFRF